MDKLTSQKILLLNQVALDSMSENDTMAIIKNFTETGIKLLDADFGWAWWKFLEDEEYKLAYKSPTTPYEPTTPRENAGNYVARTSKKPFFDSKVKRGNYLFDITKYLKSYIIIPICYKDTVYGSLVFCYKKEHPFEPQEIDLATVLGTTTAQTITIRRLVASEQKARISSERQKAYFRALIENSYEVIIIIDIKGKVLYVSSSVKKIFGLEVHDVLGKNITQFIHKNNKLNTKKYIQKILKTPATVHVTEFMFKKKDHSLVTIESVGLNMLHNTSVKGIVMNLHDISERKEEELLKETKSLLEQEKLKTEFIVNATHELRTPLAIIRGNVDLAMQSKSKKPKPARSAFKAIDYEIEHLSSIISDLALITSHGGELKNRIVYDDVPLKPLIISVVERSQVLASNQNISITTGDIPNISISGDRLYLEKMLTNLVRNSIIYGNKNGHTKINIKKSKKIITIQVVDDGMGIPKDDLPYIFERFYRVDKSRGTNKESSGLGLAIVKWIAEVHGGSVAVKSVENKGSVFSISLPLKRRAG